MKAPPLDYFGLPSPGELAGIALDYQIAQKIHACTDPHQPPDQVNDRARDVVDILLLKETFYGSGEDLTAIRVVCADVFEARAGTHEHWSWRNGVGRPLSKLTTTGGQTSRPQPARLVSNPLWMRRLPRSTHGSNQSTEPPDLLGLGASTPANSGTYARK